MDDRRDDAPRDEAERRQQRQHARRLHGDAEPRLHHPERRRQVRHLVRRPERQRLVVTRDVGLQLGRELALEGDERLVQRADPLDAHARGERMVGPADEPHALGGQVLLHEDRRGAALRADREFGVAAEHEVEPLVAQRVQHVDRDRREALAVLADEPRHQRRGIQRRARDAQRAASQLFEIACVVDGARQVVEQLVGERQELRACRRRREAARRALEEAHADRRLHLLDEQAERRRRHVQPARRGRVAAAVGHGHEGAQLAQRHVRWIHEEISRIADNF